MNKQLRDRVVLPLLLPLGILLFILVATFGFSRILLSLSAHAATATALFMVALILIFSSVTARGRRILNSQLVVMVAVVAGGAAMAGGIALATVGAEAPPKPPVARAHVSEVAKDIQFQVKQLNVPAGKPLSIDFNNEDAGTPHNIVVFDGSSDASPALFTGKIITGPAKTSYAVNALKPGTYFFHCEVHVSMTGTIVAKSGGEGAGAAKPTTAAPSTLSLVAGPSADVDGFDQTSLTVPANQSFTIAFDNQQAGIPHNVEIFEGTSASGKQVFAPPNNAGVTGPGKADYKIQALKPGTYFYHCFFHPATMTGTLKVG